MCVYYQSWMIDPTCFSRELYDSRECLTHQQSPPTHDVESSDWMLRGQQSRRSILVYFGSFPTSTLSTD